VIVAATTQVGQVALPWRRAMVNIEHQRAQFVHYTLVHQRECELQVNNMKQGQAELR